MTLTVAAMPRSPSLTKGGSMVAPLSSYVSINSDTGVLYALHSFDYEQIQDLQLLVTASDNGDPPAQQQCVPEPVHTGPERQCTRDSVPHATH